MKSWNFQVKTQNKFFKTCSKFLNEISQGNANLLQSFKKVSKILNQ